MELVHIYGSSGACTDMVVVGLVHSVYGVVVGCVYIHGVLFSKLGKKSL